MKFRAEIHSRAEHVSIWLLRPSGMMMRFCGKSLTMNYGFEELIEVAFTEH